MKRNDLHKKGPPTKRLAIGDKEKEQGPLATLLPEMLEHILTVDHAVAAGDLAFGVSLVCKRMADVCDAILRKRYVEEIRAPLHTALETRRMHIDPVWGDRVFFGQVVIAYASALKMYKELELAPPLLPDINGRQYWARFTRRAAHCIGFRTAIAYNNSFNAIPDDDEGPLAFNFTFKEVQDGKPIVLKHTARHILALRSSMQTDAILYFFWSLEKASPLDSLHPSVVEALKKHEQDLCSWWSRLCAIKENKGEDGEKNFTKSDREYFDEAIVEMQSVLWNAILWYYPHAWASYGPKKTGDYTWSAGLLYGTVGGAAEYCSQLDLSDYVLDKYCDYLPVDSETRLATLHLRLFTNSTVEYTLQYNSEEEENSEESVYYGDDWEPPSDQRDVFLLRED